MKKFFEKWKRFAIRFANFQIKILLQIIYFVIILPYRLGFVVRDMFRKKSSQTSGCWIDLQEKNDSIDSLRRQF